VTGELQQTGGVGVSNIAGKAYAMNVVSPTGWPHGIANRVIFWAARTILKNRLNGLLTLSLIHYARWAIVRPKDFPNLGEGQPKEDIKYTYEFFFSNFNGSWDQYIDSFSMSIASGLDLFWYSNVNYPKSVPIEPFHNYITANQVQTDYYYNAYPLAASNDVKAASKVRATLTELAGAVDQGTDEAFQAAYDRAIISLQHDLGRMEETPIVSLAHAATAERARVEALSR
jgi:hypothetical protein